MSLKITSGGTCVSELDYVVDAVPFFDPFFLSH